MSDDVSSCLCVCCSVCLTVYMYMSMHICVCLSVCILSQTVKICLKLEPHWQNVLRFAFLHAHVRTRVWTFTMYVDRSNAAHCNTHIFYKSTVCAYLMGMCVAWQQCTCVVSSIRILSPTECIHSGLVHKHARSYMCVVSCTYIIATKGVCIDTFRPCA